MYDSEVFDVIQRICAERGTYTHLCACSNIAFYAHNPIGEVLCQWPPHVMVGDE